jgi:hypothetical protein
MPALFAARVVAQESSAMEFGVSGGPSLSIGDKAKMYSLGYSADLMGGYSLPSLRGFGVAFGMGYGMVPLKAGPLLNLGRVELGAEYRLPFGKDFAVRGFAQGGGFYGSLSKTEAFPEVGATTSYGACISTGFSVAFTGIQKMSIGLGARYRSLLGLYDGIEGDLSASIALDIKPRRSEQSGPQIVPLSSSAVGIYDLKLDNVFPVFFKYYNDHPLGSALIVNTSKSPITAVSASFYMKQYMVAPKVCATIARLEPGESVPVRFEALFTDGMLDITEGTMVSVDINLHYTDKGQVVQTSKSEAVRIFDRNASMWDDNRKAAAFVTSKDPTVLRFAKNVLAMVKDKGSATVNKNLLAAMAFHEATRLYGLTYVTDPANSYAAVLRSKATVDFLQFPRQTLDYKGGNCSALSILYSAMLESVGIETAFITVPGHIFMAVSLDEPLDKARRDFASPEDLIFAAGKCWLPIETTQRDSGFIRAWQSAAKQWRDNLSKGQADLYPVHEAWAVYEPVGFASDMGAIALPETDKVAGAYLDEIGRFVDMQMQSQEAKLRAEVKRSQDSPRALNALGILYARYGLYDKAETAFGDIVAKTEYAPALVNLGNIRYLRDDLEGAQGYFDRARKLDEGNPNALLGLARISHDREDRAETALLYDRLMRTSPEMAAKFSYLAPEGPDGTRAANAAKKQEAVEWSE